MLSFKTQRNIHRIIPFGIIWLVFSLVYVQLEKGLLGTLTHYPSTGNPYSYAQNNISTPLAALVTGLAIGTLEVLYFNNLFITKSLSKKIVYKSFIYLILIISFLLLISVIANALQLHVFLFNEQVWNNTWFFFSSYAFWSVALYMASIIFVTQFFMEVSDNIGYRVLGNFITGRYHKPAEEERVFMFLDMKSSTSIAEALGHVRYFELLKDYYADLSDPILDYCGEVYQYVGDEIVISWKLKNGTRNNNCIACFFALKEIIKKRYDVYQKKYGIVPQFKAGVHVGKVTTGEVGIIKKEIIFTGDVLNTTARIQSLCNVYEHELLVSADLISKLHFDASQITSLGNNELRGRDDKMELFTIQNVAV